VWEWGGEAWFQGSIASLLQRTCVAIHRMGANVGIVKLWGLLSVMSHSPRFTASRLFCPGL
jgi:hypothetical protein